MIERKQPIYFSQAHKIEKDGTTLPHFLNSASLLTTLHVNIPAHSVKCSHSEYCQAPRTNVLTQVKLYKSPKLMRIWLPKTHLSTVLS